MLLLATSLVKYAMAMPQIIFVVGGLIAVIAILSSTINCAIVSRSRERTKREIAAYVAEGSIDADKAIEMLKAGGATSEDE